MRSDFMPKTHRTFIFAIICFVSAFSALFVSCTKEAKSEPRFIFKPAPNKDAAAKIAGNVITVDEMVEGYESDLYQAELKVYEIKMNRIRALALKKFMESDKRYKGNNDAFLNDIIAKGVKVSNSDINKFIKERKVPKERVDEKMKGQIKQYLLGQKKQEAIDLWMAKQTQKSPIEVYISKPERPVKDVPVGDAPTMGGESAKVTIVEFSDFQCPYCKRGATIMNDLKKKYGKKVKIAFKQFPLPFHNDAKPAAQAALCAHKQNKKLFWKMHDKMFDDQKGLSREGLLAKGSAIGVKKADFEKCLDDPSMAKMVEADIELGKKVGVKSTPTFFVNGKLVNGAQPVEVFSEIIDEELAK